jgi:hypothetical protein
VKFADRLDNAILWLFTTPPALIGALVLLCSLFLVLLWRALD